MADTLGKQLQLSGWEGWRQNLADPGTGVWTDWSERKELGRRFQEVLVSRAQDSDSLLTRFLVLRLRRAWGAEDEEPEEEPEKLAVELCRAAGLLGRAGRATGLSPETLFALDQEAREMVRLVRTLEEVFAKGGPTEDQVGFLERLRPLDSGLARERRERWLDGRSPPDEADVDLALIIRLPFLFLYELKTARLRGHTVVRTAYHLMNSRLIGDYEYSTYRRKLSEGRPAEEGTPPA